jgi:hypothetical protein
MEAKEICFRVLEKFNDKDVLKEYKASLNKGQGIEGSYICLHYNIPRPTSKNPDNTEYGCLYYEHSDKGAGFSINRVAPITYPITDGEAIETEYLFHSIEKKLEDIACDELLKLL